jgi:hypothetical protein
MDAQLLCALSLIGTCALRCEAVNGPETFFTDLKRPRQTFTSSCFLLCLAGKHHASFKSAACSGVSITLPAFIVNANYSVM